MSINDHELHSGTTKYRIHHNSFIHVLNIILIFCETRGFVGHCRFSQLGASDGKIRTEGWIS